MSLVRVVFMEQASAVSYSSPIGHAFTKLCLNAERGGYTIERKIFVDIEEVSKADGEVFVIPPVCGLVERIQELVPSAHIIGYGGRPIGIGLGSNNYHTHIMFARGDAPPEEVPEAPGQIAQEFMAVVRSAVAKCKHDIKAPIATKPAV